MLGAVLSVDMRRHNLPPPRSVFLPLGFLVGLADVDQALYVAGEPAVVLLPQGVSEVERRRMLAELLPLIP